MFSGMKLLAITHGDENYLKLALAGNILTSLIIGKNLMPMQKEGGDMTPFLLVFVLEAIALGLSVEF
jgi:hypothetical protein